MLLLSKQNIIFFGCFDPKNDFLDNLNKCSLGWSNLCFGEKRSTGSLTILAYTQVWLQALARWCLGLLVQYRDTRGGAFRAGQSVGAEQERAEQVSEISALLKLLNMLTQRFDDDVTDDLTEVRHLPVFCHPRPTCCIPTNPRQTRFIDVTSVDSSVQVVILTTYRVVSHAF